MKSGNILLLYSLATVFIVASCSTTGMQRSEDVQSSMQIVDDDIKLVVVQLDAIGASLDELTKPGQADTKKAFDLFSGNASKIKEMEKDFSKHAAEMEASGKAYFKEWDSDKQNYDNTEIQKKSDERRAALGETYDKIAQNNIGVKEAFQTYVSDINEIQRFLSNDLTSDGMDSITPISDKVVNNGTQLKYELQNLQKAIENARAEMRRG
ncbi:MAG: hypothetical protein CL666_03885 [Balneola sp.]|nr:hypothetical protein [Balneola sp.]